MNDKSQTREMIKNIVQKLITGYKPEKIILFGSHAYGAPREDSDIDLLIIKETDKPSLDRWVEVKRLLRDRTRTVSVSPLVYTAGELEERLGIKDFFLEEVLEKGEVLYG
jgi:uncharacterized protein